MSRKVDYHAIADGFDRRYDDQDYSGVAAAVVEFVRRGGRVLDVGCGTGHWLAAVAARVDLVAGLDPSRRMLGIAKRKTGAALACGRAESLPWRAGSFDRILCINAFHHLSGMDAFLREARRVLSPSGGIMIVGLDPHTRRDRWWIYDYFPEALALDWERYRAAGQIRAALAGVGFGCLETREVQHIPASISAREAFARGHVERGCTSQLAVLSDDEYARGIALLTRTMDDESARGRDLELSADLRLYATFGWLEGPAARAAADSR